MGGALLMAMLMILKKILITAVATSLILQKVSSNDKLSVHLSNGGGWAAKIYPVE